MIRIQFSRSVLSNSLWPHGLQHTRPTCPLPMPTVYSNSSSLSQWCHPTISSSVVPFSSRLQSFPASGSFLMSQLFASGGQSIGASASTSVLPMNIQDRFPLGLVWSPFCPRSLKSLLQHHSLKASVLRRSAFFTVQLSHLYVTYWEKNVAVTMTFVSKVMSLLFNNSSKFIVVNFLQTHTPLSSVLLSC